jgi:serine/threonine-protein kinase RsbW
MDKSVLLDICSTFEMLKLVDQVSEQYGQMAGLDEDGVHGLGIAVREAAANAVKHGNRCDHHKRVRIEYAVSVGPARPRVVVRVCDEGNGFDTHRLSNPLAPENISEPSGRGILLMRAFMDDVQVHALPSGGTEIVLAKAINRTSRTG